MTLGRVQKAKRAWGGACIWLSVKGALSPHKAAAEGVVAFRPSGARQLHAAQRVRPCEQAAASGTELPKWLSFLRVASTGRGS